MVDTPDGDEMIDTPDEIEKINPIIVEKPKQEGERQRLHEVELTPVEQRILDKVQEIAYKTNILIEDANYKTRNEC